MLWRWYKTSRQKKRKVRGADQPVEVEVPSQKADANVSSDEPDATKVIPAAIPTEVVYGNPIPLFN